MKQNIAAFVHTDTYKINIAAMNDKCLVIAVLDIILSSTLSDVKPIHLA